MGISVADVPLVVCFGAYCFELVSAQFALQPVGLWMAPIAESISFLILGAHHGWFARSKVPRLIPACADCLTVDVPAFTNSLSQR